MYVSVLLAYLIFIVTQLWCLTPNCIPGNQFKFYDFPVEACSNLFKDRCKFHPKGYYKSLGDASLVKIRETAVIPTCAFFKSENLLEIYGMRSKIIVLATGAFMDLPRLKAIHLAFNNIHEVRKDVFQNVSAELLDLSWNKIAYIDSKAFSGMKNLNHLNLSRNSLVTVPLNSLSTSLRSLNLAYNLLNRIILSSTSFHHLTHVNLSNNAISKIAISMDFPLKSIDHPNNRLENFDYLDIQYVGIFKIGQNLFKDVPQYLENLNAKEIDIYPNPWNCRHLFSLWDKLFSLNIRLAPRNPQMNPSLECMNTQDMRLLKYTNSELSSCTDDHDCPSSMICRATKCWDPCKESLCHQSGLCETIQHQFSCLCPSGLFFDPLDIYSECENVECFIDSHCFNKTCLFDKCVGDSGGPIVIPIKGEEEEAEEPWWIEEIPYKVPPKP